MSLVDEWNKKIVLDKKINQLNIELQASESEYENLQKELKLLRKKKENLLKQIWIEVEKKGRVIWTV